MDPFDASSRWHHWIVDGTRDQMDRVLASLDASLPPGWKRLSGEQLDPFRAFVRNGSGWYAMDTTAADDGATLSVDRVRDSELRGGHVWFAGPPHPRPIAYISAAWDRVVHFLDDGIIPAARAVGANLHLPSREDLFFAELPFTIREHLTAFSDVARKSLPLDREEGEKWRDFVIAAFRSRTVIDAEMFVRWLVAKGWPEDAANELNAQFFDQCLLLSRFADEVLTG